MVYPAAQQSVTHPIVFSSDKREEAIHIRPRAWSSLLPLAWITETNSRAQTSCVQLWCYVLHRHIIRQSCLSQHQSQCPKTFLKGCKQRHEFWQNSQARTTTKTAPIFFTLVLEKYKYMNIKEKITAEIRSNFNCRFLLHLQKKNYHETYFFTYFSLTSIQQHKKQKLLSIFLSHKSNYNFHWPKRHSLQEASFQSLP